MAAAAESQPASLRLKEVRHLLSQSLHSREVRLLVVIFNSCNQGISQVLSIVDTLHQPWLDGLELLQDAMDNKRVLSTGIAAVDSFLHGGLRVGQLTELAGPSSSGKTQVGNFFSSKRIRHFLSENGSPPSSQDDAGIVHRVMSRIWRHSVFEISLLFDMLHQLEFRLGSQECMEGCKVQLLIVDSVSSLITPILGGGSSQGYSLMASLGVLLKKLAHEHDIAILAAGRSASFVID
ncbi:unnamed protein product [Linum tenue]|uniref:RecA family profile 1 domain-containing protein n=1 Tax=Linum tenue TaxID=586396 RepID=A0AAV0N0D6_9ROSI|nr:unnamed protein product [Linum tenue]